MTIADDILRDCGGSEDWAIHEMACCASVDCLERFADGDVEYTLHEFRDASCLAFHDTEHPIHLPFQYVTDAEEWVDRQRNVKASTIHLETVRELCETIRRHDGMIVAWLTVDGVVYQGIGNDVDDAVMWLEDQLDGIVDPMGDDHD